MVLNLDVIQHNCSLTNMAVELHSLQRIPARQTSSILQLGTCKILQIHYNHLLIAGNGNIKDVLQCNPCQSVITTGGADIKNVWCHDTEAL